jgi:spermidine synthase
VTESSAAAPVGVEPTPTRPYPLPPLPPGRYYVDHERSGDPLADLFCVDRADPFDLYSFRARDVVAAKRTAFQHVIVADTYSFGRALFIDGSIQSSADDEQLYHELLVQPAMLLHPEPRDVLIIGGGEGATLRETLAHASVRRACMVDIDREAVEICRKHLTAWHRGAFDDPRVDLRFADGRAHVESEEDLYDVIIVDVVDMLDNGPAQSLYTRQFYQLLKRRLRPEGIVAVQGLEFSCLDYKEHAALRRTLATAFADVHSYAALVPSFLGSWGFLLASDSLPAESIAAERIDAAIARKLGPEWLTHVDGSFLASRFVHDRETRFLLSLPGPVLEDGSPFIPPPEIEDLEPPVYTFPALRA